MDVHMCSGHLKRVNLFGKAKTCLEKIEMQKTCHQKSDLSYAVKSKCGDNGDHQGCCQNDSFQLDADTDLVNGQSNVADIQNVKYFLAAFVSTYLLSDWQSTFTKLEIYKPPLKIPDVQVLFQVFRL